MSNPKYRTPISDTKIVVNDNIPEDTVIVITAKDREEASKNVTVKDVNNNTDPKKIWEKPIEYPEKKTPWYKRILRRKK